MKYILFAFTLVLLLAGCTGKNTDKVTKRNYPSHNYRYANIDTALLKYTEKDYVPVYSDIYHQDGTKRFLLTATVSLRNTSMVDTAIILSVTYYDSHGKKLKEYIDKAVILSPLESIEFVVEEAENRGGAGASFIIDWGAARYSKQLLIQSIMIGSYGQQGISFLTEARVMNSHFK